MQFSFQSLQYLRGLDLSLTDAIILHWLAFDSYRRYHHGMTSTLDMEHCAAALDMEVEEVQKSIFMLVSKSMLEVEEAEVDGQQRLYYRIRYGYLDLVPLTHAEYVEHDVQDAAPVPNPAPMPPSLEEMVERFKAEMYGFGINMMSEAMLIDAIDFYTTSQSYLKKIHKGTAKVTSMLRNQVAKIAEWRNRDELLAITPWHQRMFEVKDGRLVPKSYNPQARANENRLRDFDKMRSHFANTYMDIHGQRVLVMDSENAFTREYLQAIRSVSIDQYTAHAQFNKTLRQSMGVECYVPADV